MKHRHQGLEVGRERLPAIQKRRRPDSCHHRRIQKRPEIVDRIPGEQDVACIEAQDILSFLNFLRSEYVPRRIAGDNSKKLAPKTVYNIYETLASFFTWASREFNIPNLDQPGTCSP